MSFRQYITQTTPPLALTGSPKMSALVKMVNVPQKKESNKQTNQYYEYRCSNVGSYFFLVTSFRS